MVMNMNKFVELPLVEPIYSTYHYQGMATATIGSNPSIRNWYLNQVMDLRCGRDFFKGLSTPHITVMDSGWPQNPHLEKRGYSSQFVKGYINYIIRELLDNGYYVVFEGVDDYYVQGKTLYKERHRVHDGLICGYNQEDKTYCIYAYDSNWVYRKFWTPQRCFNAGRMAMHKKGEYGNICGIKPHLDKVEFSPEIVYKNLLEYLDSSFEKYPINSEGEVFGTIVHAYIGEYIKKLMDGSIPYEKMDHRILRVIWEHKKVMLERIIAMEEVLQLGQTYSDQYRPLVDKANSMRMLYASHQMKRRDSVLPILYKKLLELMDAERKILITFTEKVGKELKK